MLRIGLDPTLFRIGGLVMTWHSFFTLVGVVVAVWLALRWAPLKRLRREAVENTAFWGILGGLVGARLVHVLDQWEFYAQNPGQIFALWQGGIAIYGAILGGFAGGALYALRARLPVGRLADLAAPVMVLGQAIGRIGDVINGEHLARPTSLPWGVVYTHPASPSAQVYGSTPTHPAVAYELLWDLAIFALLRFVLWDRLKPDGMLFALYLALYSVGRFFISFLRVDREWVLGLTQAQVIALAVLAVTVPLLLMRARFATPAPAPQRACR